MRNFGLSLMTLSLEGQAAINHGLTVIQRRLLGRRGGRVSTGAMEGLFVAAILAFVLYIVIANFWPSAQSANETIQAETGTDAGTTTSKTFFNIGLWIIVAGVFVALIMLLIRKVRG